MALVLTMQVLETIATVIQKAVLLVLVAAAAAAAAAVIQVVP
jgi:hypothetical protein